MAEILINKIVDREALEAEKAFVISRVREMEEIIKAFNQNNRNKLFNAEDWKSYREAAKENQRYQEDSNRLALQRQKIREADAKAALAEFNLAKAQAKEEERKAAAAERKAAADERSAKARGAANSDLSNRDINDIPSTITVPTISDGSKTGPVVNEQELAEVQEILEANAWAAQQLAENAGKAKDEINDLGEAFPSGTSSDWLDQFNGSLDDNLRLQTIFQGELDDVNAELKELSKSTNAAEKNSDKYTNKVAALKGRQAELKRQLSDVNGTIKLQTKEYNSAEGSLERLRARLSLTQKAYDNLGDSVKKSSLGQGLLLQSQKLTAEIKAQEGATGRFQRNVGNYSSAITKGFSKAYSGLKTIANILPGLGISGLIGVISGPVIKLVQSLSSLSDAQKRSRVESEINNKIQENAIEVYSKEVSKLEILRNELLDKNNTEKDRISLAKEYNKSVDVSNQLDTTQINNTNLLNKAIDRQIQLLKDRAIAKAAENIVSEKAEKTFAAELKLEQEYSQYSNKTIKDITKNVQSLVDIQAKGKGLKGVDYRELMGLADLPLQQLERLSASSSAASLLLDKTTREQIQKANKQLKFIEGYRKGEVAMSQGVKRLVDDYNDANFELEAAIKRANELVTPIILIPDNKGGDLAKYVEAEKKAAYELARYRLQLAIDEQKSISGAEGTGDLRITARKKQADLEKQLAKLTHDYELKQKELTKSGALKIGEEYAQGTTELNKKMLADISLWSKLERIARTEEERKTLEAMAKLQKENDDKERERRLNDRTKDMEFGLKNRLTDLENQFEAERQATLDQYKVGKISKERYEKELLAIQNKYSRLALEEEINYYANLITISGLSDEEKKKALEKFYQLKKQLRDKDYQQEEDTTDKEIELERKKNEAILSLTNELRGFVFDIFKGQVDSQINQVQGLIDELEKQKQKEIEVANSTITNAQERADAIAVIEARANAKREQYELKQRQLQYEKAKYERQATITEIIQNTAVAAIKAFKDGGWVMSGLALALGAAQLARVLATPIPRYKDGTEDHPGGLAIVGDGGKSEAVKLPTGEVYKTPATSTLTYLPKGTQVFSDYDKYALSASLSGMGGKYYQSNTLEKAIKKNGQDIVKAVSKIPGSMPKPIIYQTQSPVNNWIRGK